MVQQGVPRQALDEMSFNLVPKLSYMSLPHRPPPPTIHTRLRCSLDAQEIPRHLGTEFVFQIYVLYIRPKPVCMSARLSRTLNPGEDKPGLSRSVTRSKQAGGRLSCSHFRRTICHDHVIIVVATLLCGMKPRRVLHTTHNSPKNDTINTIHSGKIRLIT